MEIQRVSKESVDVFWETVKYWIQSATDQSKGRHTLKTTYDLLQKDLMQMFLIIEDKVVKAVYVTQVTQYPAMNVLSILFCGGSEVIKNVKQIEDFFRKFAKSTNCKALEIIGRKGWCKVIKNNNLNFKETGLYYEMAT